MPADRMANAFNMLRANDLIWGYMVSNYLLGKEPFPFDLLYWNADSTAMPARAHRFYLEQFYIRDAFAKGELTLGGTPITLADIKGPVYHVATKEDHIAPAASVYRGAKEMSRAEGALRALRVGPHRRRRQPAGAAGSTSSGPTPT